ncbi:homocysteine S-methyltransferase family protein, partial [Vibrio harveyi]
MDCSMKKLT